MKRTVILANGSFPKKGGEPWRILESAKRVIACDGAATTFQRRFHRAPDFIIGDLDSYKNRENPPSVIHNSSFIVKIAEQSDNDLAKAIRFCREHHWNDLVIIGATGKREDHELGNIFRAMEEGIEVVTDCGRFIPFVNRKSNSITAKLTLPKGTSVSVFATNPKTRMKSRGLEWPLDSVKFRNLYCATLNRASAKNVYISSDMPFFVYKAI